jgi:SAM-dependent methyltransferase
MVTGIFPGFAMSACRVGTPIVNLLRRQNDTACGLSLLAFGPHGGAFILAVLQVIANARFTLVQPAPELAAMCGGHGVIEVLQERFEDLALETGRFDIVHCSQPLGHLIDPRIVLREHHRVLKDRGLLIVDAPGAAALGHDLGALMQAVGFSTLEAPDAPSGDRLFYVVEKTPAPPVAGNIDVHEPAGQCVSARIVPHAEFLIRARQRRAA